MVNTEGGVDDEEFRVAAVVDRVNTTMEVWLGTTMACAQCHNHKYDPFTQKEYYQLFAYFNNTQDSGRSVEPTLAVPPAAQLLRRGLVQATTTLVLKELAKPRPTHVMLRGNHKNLGELVQPGVPARLHALR